MPAQVTLASCPIEFVVPGQTGFTWDAVEAVLLIERLGLEGKKPFRDFSAELRKHLQEKFKVDLSESQLLALNDACVLAYNDFKKKLDLELPLALDLASTPSLSTNEAQDSWGSACPR